MSLWLQNTGTLYLPPPKPVAKVYNTDEYVQRTGYYFYAGTERLLLVGHPYYDVEDPNHKIVVPKVSANQYRVFQLMLPDPNKFAIADACVFNPEKERLVWKLAGLQIDRGGPLGIGATGNPLFNKYMDNENPTQYPEKQDNASDYRQDVAFEPKQIQMFMVGCAPPTGQYWDTAKPCEKDKLNPGDCPPIELLHTYIQDGDMCEIGFGNVNFQSFQEDKAGTPLELTNEIALWPDFGKMTKDIYGDQIFFYSRKEQMYARHYYSKAGVDGDALPDGSYLNKDPAKPQNYLGPYSYFTTPSGSLVSSDSNMFNRAYWLHKSLGANNGILWGNQCFVTVVDNTRNINFNLSIYSKETEMGEQYVYKSGDFKNYTRHTEEYELEIIVELCKVPLNPETLAHINVMNPKILEDWDLNFVPPPPEGLQDTYRFILSKATKCPEDVEPIKPKDPWDKYTFWTIDLREKLSSELNQFPLGKRFLYQTGMVSNKRIRPPCDEPPSCKRSCKRRRK